MIPVEIAGTENGACLLDVLVHKILANKFKSGVLEEHVELPRFKAYMKYFYHINLSDSCFLQIDLQYPLITNESTWAILEQCTGEVMLFSQDVAYGTEPKKKRNPRTLISPTPQAQQCSFSPPPCSTLESVASYPCRLTCIIPATSHIEGIQTRLTRLSFATV